MINPRLSYLKMEGLVIDGDGECGVILVVDAYEGPPQPHAAPPLASRHLRLGSVVRKDASRVVQHEPPDSRGVLIRHFSNSIRQERYLWYLILMSSVYLYCHPFITLVHLDSGPSMLVAFETNLTEHLADHNYHTHVRVPKPSHPLRSIFDILPRLVADGSDTLFVYVALTLVTLNGTEVSQSNKTQYNISQVYSITPKDQTIF